MDRHWTHQTAIVLIALFVGYVTLYSGIATASTGNAATAGVTAPAQTPAAKQPNPGYDDETVDLNGVTKVTKNPCEKPANKEIEEKCKNHTINCGTVTIETPGGGTLTCPKKNKSEASGAKDCKETGTQSKACEDALAIAALPEAGPRPNVVASGPSSDNSKPDSGGGYLPNSSQPFQNTGAGEANSGSLQQGASAAQNSGAANGLSGMANNSGYSPPSYSQSSGYSAPSGGYSGPSYNFGGSVGGMSGGFQESSQSQSSGYSPSNEVSYAGNTFSGNETSAGQPSQAQTELANTASGNSAMPTAANGQTFTQPLGTAYTPATPLKATWTSDTPAPSTNMFTEENGKFKLSESFLAEADAQQKARDEQMKKILAQNIDSANPTADTGKDTWTALSEDANLGNKVVLKIKTKAGEQSIEVDNVVWYDAAAQRGNGRDITLNDTEKHQTNPTMTVSGEGSSGNDQSQSQRPPLPPELFDGSYSNVSGGDQTESFMAEAQANVFDRPAAGDTQYSNGTDANGSSSPSYAPGSGAQGQNVSGTGSTHNESATQPYREPVAYPQSKAVSGTAHVAATVWNGFVNAVRAVQHAWMWVLSSLHLL